MKSSYKIILAACVSAFFLNLLFGKLVAAKISTWPLLNRLKILSPQAPIIINNREEIRLTDSGQISDAVNAAKSKISRIVVEREGRLIENGSAVNLTADGAFAAAKEVFAEKGNYWIFLPDGRFEQIKQKVEDLGSGLVFFRVNLNNVPTAPLADSKSLLSGEKIIFFSPGPQGIFKDWPAYLVAPENDRYGLEFEAGKIQRVLRPDLLPLAAKGSAVLNVKGEVAGLANGTLIVPADVIKSAMSIFLKDSGKITRPNFDFVYMETGEDYGKIFKVPAKPKVISAGKASLLKAGDFIISVGDKTLGSENFLEEALENYSPGDAVEFTVQRDGKNLVLIIKPKEY